MILFPGSVTLEALGIIEEALNMYIDDEGRIRRNPEGPYSVIERLQQAHIMLQNALFADRQKIADKIKETTGKLVKNRAEAIQWKENLELNIGMYEKAQPMHHRSLDHEAYFSIIDSMWDQLATSKFIHRRKVSAC